MIDLGAIEKLLAEASPGPWMHYPSGSYIYSRGWKVAQLECAHIRNPQQQQDASLISALRNAAPQLIALARAGSRLYDAAALVSARVDVDHYAMPSDWAQLNGALAAFREAQQGPTGDLNHTTQPE